MDIRFSRHAKNKLRLYKLSQADVESVIESGERLTQGNKWESGQGKLKVVWAFVGPYVLVVTVIRSR